QAAARTARPPRTGRSMPGNLSSPAATMTTFEYGSTLDAAPSAVWAWHLRPGALERLTPPWDHVRVVAREGGIADGGTVELRIGRGPLARRWVARHRDAVPGRGFVDEQV